MKKDNETKFDTEKLNETISLTNKILKISLILIIALGTYVILAVLRQIKLFNTLGKIVKLLTPVIIGLVIAWLFNPFVKWLQKHKIKRVFGVIISYILLIGGIALFLGTLLPILYNEIVDFAETIPTLFDKIKEWLDNFLDRFSGIESIDIEATKQSVMKNIENFGSNLTNDLPQTIVNVFKSVITGMGTFIVGLVIGFFFLLGFDNVSDTLVSFLPKKHRPNGKELLEKLDTSLRNFVTGQLLDALLICVVSCIAFYFIGLKSPILFAIFCGITNIIPYIGPYIGAVPAVIVGFAMSPTIGMLVIISIVIIQFIEGNFIQAVIISKTTKLNPITIISGLLVFGHFWGILGMLISTPVIASVKTIIVFIDEKTDWFNFID